MRRWWDAIATAAAEVADRPGRWVAGALAWIVTIGWLPLLVGVARPPGTAELTFLGAGIVTSAAWPWNLVIGTAAAATLAALAVTLVAAAEASLVRGSAVEAAAVWRAVVAGLACVVPVAVGVLLLGLALAMIGPAEFNAPDQELGPVARTAMRLAPVAAAVAVVAGASAAIHAAAIRSTLAGASVGGAMRTAPRILARAGNAAVMQAVAILVARIAYLGLAAALLRVLWAPIGERLATAGMDVAVGLLLVGFVAIWLCLVLGGGALHAWGSASWSRVLDGSRSDAGRSPARMETSSGP